VVATVAATLAAGGAWYGIHLRGERREAEADRRAKLVSLKNLAIGRLENAEAFEGGLRLAAEAATAFEEIAKARPDLPLGPRNLAVARLVTLAGGGDRGRIPAAGQGPTEPRAGASEALAAVEALKRIEPDSVTTSVITARVAAVVGDFDAARAELEKAGKQAPDEAWVWYERYRLDRHAADEPVRDAAENALGRAYKAAPRNLWVVREWLGVLADRRSDRFTEVIDVAKEAIGPIAEGIEQRAGTNVLDLLDDAQAAAERGDWHAAAGAARQFANATAHEGLALSDKREVDRSALEFAAIDFPPEFYEEVGLRRLAAPAPIEVAYSASRFGFPDPAEKFDPLTDAALADFDLDGDLDVMSLSDGRLEVAFRGQAGGSAAVSRNFTRFLAADLDADAGESAAPFTDGRACHDADPDVIAYGLDGILVLENRDESGVRSLVEIEQAPELVGVGPVIAAQVADFDLDGDLDLVVSTNGGLSLWANVGGLRFENRTPLANVPLDLFTPTVILPVDIDRDVDLDLVLAGGTGAPGHLENLRHGNMRWRPCAEADVAPAAELIDADGNASWDLAVAGVEGLTLLSSQTPEAGRWVVTGAEAVGEGAFRRLWALDYDNDGLTDLLARRDGGPVLLHNLGDRFEATDLFRGFEGELVAADFGDVDGDGDLDLMLASATGVSLLENEGGNANGWLDVSLSARPVNGGGPSQGGRVNHAGLGSLLELKAGPVSQAAVVRRPVTHFGLGPAGKPDVLRVLWTTGIPQNVLEPKPKSSVCEKRGLKGS